MRLVVLLPALTALLAGAEGRLVFPAFGEYIRLHPPFNYIAVTAALYGVALLVFLHVAGGHLTLAPSRSAQYLKPYHIARRCVWRRPLCYLYVAGAHAVPKPEPNHMMQNGTLYRGILGPTTVH